MLDSYKQLLANQFDAAFCTLDLCVMRCPDDNWQRPVANLQFNQAVFHTLFFADLYLGPDEFSFREQQFHQVHVATFGDYEELEPRRQVLRYQRPFIVAYQQHCRDKAARTIAGETTESLQGPSGFAWLKFPRDELHVYNIRHLQHHAAQLSLRLRLDAGVEIPWVGSGWRNF